MSAHAIAAVAVGSGELRMLEGEVLFAFFAFYVSLATVFIPLTFALIASLKDQYRRSLESPALQAANTKIFKFQDLFFYYNDAFAEAVIKTAVLGILAVGGIYWIFVAEPDIAPPLEKTYERVVVSVLWFLFWLGSNVYMLVFHSRLYRQQANSRGMLPRFLESLLLVPRGAFAESAREFATEYPGDAQRTRRGIQPIRFLELGNLSLLFALSLAVWLEPVTLEWPLLLFALHSTWVLAIWWHLYSTWAPFTFLRELEDVTVSPAYAERFLANPHKEQWRTYSRFMHQYEEDDSYRANDRQMKAILETVGVEIEKRQVGLLEWKNAIVRSLTKPTVLNVIYVGCGYCGLVDTLRTQVKEWFRKASGRTDEAAAEGVGDPIWQNLTVRTVLIDSYTIDNEARAIQDDTKLKRVKERAAGCITLSGDVFHLLRHKLCGTGEVAVLEGGPTPASGKALGEEWKQWDGVEVPPLVVLLNTTYGALFDPVARFTANMEEETRTLGEQLVRAQQSSIRTLLRTLGQVFGRTGFALLVHSKRAGWLPERSSPYTSDCWIPLKGTDSHKGVFLLGRFRERDPDPSLMFCRWISSGSFQADVHDTLEQLGMERFELCSGSITVDEAGCAGPRAADARFVMSGAAFLPRLRGTRQTTGFKERS